MGVTMLYIQGYASPEPQENTPLLSGTFDFIDDPIGPPSFLLQC